MSLLAFAGTARGEESEGPIQPEEARRWAIEGYVRERFRLRFADSESDGDLYTDFFANATRAGTSPIRVRAQGRIVADVIGDQAPGEALRDTWDGFDHDLQMRMYEAYAEWEQISGGPLSVRGGRQYLDEGNWFHFDGVRLDGDLKEAVAGLDATLLVGVPVRFGESERSGNWIAGLVARLRLDAKTRLRFEYYHVSEFFEGQNGTVVDPVQQPVSIPAQDFEDDLFGLSIWHKPCAALRLFGRFTLLNGDANELQLRATWSSDDKLWTVVADWYQLFDRLHNVTNDLSPFVPMLGSFEPYTRLSLRATRRIGDEWVIQGGISFRQLTDEGDEGVFNHEYGNYHVSVTRFGLWDERLGLTLTANGYSSSSNDIFTLGGHADFELRKGLTLDGGIDYALYKYDFFLDTEHEDVWTYSVRVRWKANERVRAKLEFSVDDDRFTTWTTVVLEAEVRF